MAVQIFRFSQIRFDVEAEFGEYLATFRVFDHEAYTMDDQPLFRKKDSAMSPDAVATREEAAVFMHGSVKSDGCSNWYIDEQDGAYLHFCSREEMLRISLIMAACFDLAGAARAGKVE